MSDWHLNNIYGLFIVEIICKLCYTEYKYSIFYMYSAIVLDSEIYLHGSIVAESYIVNWVWSSSLGRYVLIQTFTECVSNQCTYFDVLIRILVCQYAKYYCTLAFSDSISFLGIFTCLILKCYNFIKLLQIVCLSRKSVEMKSVVIWYRQNSRFFNSI